MPTIVYTLNSTGGDSTAIQDATLVSIDPDTNYSGITEINMVSDGSGNPVWNGILRLSDLSGIPNGSTITGVTIELFDISGGTTNTVNIYRVLRAVVVAQATYNSYSTGNAWSAGGGTGSGTDRAASASGSMSFTASTAAYISSTNGGLIDDVQDWLDGVATNGGWIFLPSGTSSSNDAIAGAGTDASRPKVTVTYTEGGGGTINAATIIPQLNRRKTGRFF